jgi:methyl-accepting chemotaxis protein
MLGFTRIAAHKLGEVGIKLENNWRHQNIETIKQGLQHMIAAAGYIEKAAHYQGDSSQKLATAIKVTTQVNEQLADSAIFATESASRLERVVNDLRSVIGQ